MDMQRVEVKYTKTLTESGSGEFVVNRSRTLHTCHLVLGPCEQCSVEATIDALGYDNLYG